jgi:hypothetical protein
MVEWLGDYQPTKSKLWTPSAYRGIARSACAHQIIGIVEWGSAMSALKAPRELAQRMRARKLGQDDDGFVRETFCQPRDDARAAARASSIGAPRLPTCRTSKADGSCQTARSSSRCDGCGRRTNDPLSRREVVLHGVGGFWSDLALSLVLVLPTGLP